MFTTARFLLIICICLISISSVFSQPSNPLEAKINQLKQSNAVFYDAKAVLTALLPLKTPENELERHAQRLQLDPQELANIMSRRPQQLTLTLPFKNNTITVDLYAQSVLSPDFEVRTGNWETSPYAPGMYYRGIVRDMPESMAAISFFQNEIIGVLCTRTLGNLNLGHKEKTGNALEYVLFEDKYLPEQPMKECAIEVSGKIKPTHSGGSAPEVPGYVGQFFEADYALFQNKGSVQNTVNYITGFFNVVASIYNLETVSIGLSQVYVWTTPDPYIYTNSSTALNSFKDYRTDFTGTLGHLVSLEGSGLGGRAFLDVICDNGNNYAFSGINSTYQGFPTYSWTSFVVAHEMGHNFSSQHTHWCGWPGGAIDDCGPTAGYAYETPPSCGNAPTPAAGGGTIMSYCHLVSGVGVGILNAFGTHPGNAIRAALADALNAGCIQASAPNYTCTAPTSLTVSNITATSTTLGWNAVGGAGSYNLQYRAAPNGPWTTLNNVLPPVTIGNLQGNTTYDVQVQAVCSPSNLSPYLLGSGWVTQTSVCTEPSGLSALPNGSTANLAWTENASATTWEIQWGTLGFALGSGTTITTNTCSHTLTGLASGMAYAFYVRSICGAGNSQSTWIGPYTFYMPMPNDQPGNAIEVLVNAPCSGNIYNNVGATVGSGEFNPTVANGGFWNTPANQTVWFKFVAPASGSIHINTDILPYGTNQDCQIALYNTANPTSVNHLLVANEDGSGTENPSVSYSGLTPGTTYYIQVDGWENISGSFCIEVEEHSFQMPEPNTCTSYTLYNVNGFAAPNKWFNVYTLPGQYNIGHPVAAIRTVNNLGTVTVREVKTPLPIQSTGNGVKYMQRYYTVTNTLNANAPRDVRLFFTDEEFNDFKNSFNPPSNAVIEDLNVSVYSGSTINCATTDNPGANTLISSVSAVPIGNSGKFYLEFNSTKGEFAAILGNTALPVELLRFEGFAEKKGNLIEWRTTQEVGLAEYVLERSTDGVQDWAPLHALAPEGGETVEHQYSYTDASAPEVAYYRLAIYNEDGSFEYSNWIRLERQPKAAIKAIVPNPSHDWIQVEYVATEAADLTFYVFGSDGRMVSQFPLTVEPGNILLPLDISALAPGLYYCSVQGARGLSFVKQ